MKRRKFIIKRAYSNPSFETIAPKAKKDVEKIKKSLIEKGYHRLPRCRRGSLVYSPAHKIKYCVGPNNTETVVEVWIFTPKQRKEIRMEIEQFFPKFNLIEKVL